MINDDDFIELEEDFVDLATDELEGEVLREKTARWRLENLLDEKRLQDELDDYLDY